jgi:uncharacterized membrane protein YphA (DoxX/SURF4 family)
MFNLNIKINKIVISSGGTFLIILAALAILLDIKAFWISFVAFAVFSICVASLNKSKGYYISKNSEDNITWIAWIALAFCIVFCAIGGFEVVDAIQQSMAEISQ